MSSNLLDRARRSFSLRLILWYAAVSVLAYMIVFALAYRSLSSSLKGEDRKAIVAAFKDYANDYEKGELTGLEARINSERDSEKPMLFFVRVARPDSSTLFLSLPDRRKVLDLRQTAHISVNRKDQRIRLRARPGEAVFEILTFALPDGNFIQIGTEIEQREILLRRFRRVFTDVMIPAVLLGLIGGYVVTFRALRPIRQLTTTVTSIIETGGVSARVPPGKTEDELSGLVILFNRMLERIENLMTGMKESLDNVAHDLRTPMTRLRGIAENVLQSNQGLEACREALSDGMEESERIMKMLNTLMDISEAKTGTLKLDMERVDVSVLVEEAVELYRYIAEEKHVTIRAGASEDLPMAVDPTRIRQVVGNLLDNAVKYTPEGGRVDVKVYRKEKEVIIAVRDTGIGISKEDLPKIWDRLYRGDKSRSQRGLGLGLSLVKSIVEVHGGHVEVSSEPQAGSTFVVYLPLST